MLLQPDPCLFCFSSSSTKGVFYQLHSYRQSHYSTIFINIGIGTNNLISWIPIGGADQNIVLEELGILAACPVLVHHSFPLGCDLFQAVMLLVGWVRGVSRSESLQKKKHFEGSCELLSLNLILMVISC